MAQYIFNIVEEGKAPDTIGTEYPSAEVARMEAVRFAGELLKLEPERLWKGAELRIEATDEAGLLMFTIVIVGVDSPSLPKAAADPPIQQVD